MKKYIFLDFDGVLNTHAFIQWTLNHLNKVYHPSDHIDPKCVELVNQLADELDAYIVISSSWRKSFTVEELQSMLQAKGLKRMVAGRTPELETGRGYEIQEWIEGLGILPEQVVILDDMHEMEPLAHRHIKTSFYKGFGKSELAAALELFNGQS